MDYQQKFARRARTAQPNPIDGLLKTVMANPKIISFAVGTPDTALLPIDLFTMFAAQAAKKYGRDILQYSSPKGFAPLVNALQPLLAKRGIQAKAETIHIATGGSGALNNACMTLLDAGDTVLVENPTYSPAIKTFRAYEAKVVGIDCDQNGMLPNKLEAALKAQPVKCIYVLPTFQNPTGNSMPTERRQQLAALAKQYNTLIIEDDVYYDLRFRGEDIPALQTYAPDHVLYISSLSKILAPAVRVGFAVIPEPILAKFLILKHSIDMNTSAYTQAIAAEFLLSDKAEPHIAHLRQTYAVKAKVMVSALQKYMPTEFSWNDPEGGLFLWVTGPKNFDAPGLLPKAIAAEVAFVPGQGFYVDAKGHQNTIRLSFAHPSVERIEQGIAILAAQCKEHFSA